MKKSVILIIVSLIFIGSCATPSAPQDSFSSYSRSPESNAIPGLTFKETLDERVGLTPTNLIPSGTRETQAPAPTMSPSALYSISGMVFFYYNANGEMEAGESPLMFMPISLNDHAYGPVSDENGYYQIKDVPAGRYDLRIESPEMFDPAYLFRYIAISDERIQNIQIPVTLRVAGDVIRDFGLTQGFLTVPV